MLWLKSFHIIFVVTWFAALFYLPRLFVYHADCKDKSTIDYFKIMERRLFRGIMTPSAILATVLGFSLLSYNLQGYMQQPWMHAKLGLVALLWVYHGVCWHYLKAFQQDNNQKSGLYFRIFNELPAIVLVAVVILVVVKPQF